MFKPELLDKLSKIFGFKKTTFSSPDDIVREQDVLFIDIESAQSRVTSTHAYSKVLGSLTVFSQMDRLPFGFFNKKIQQAEPFLTKDFLFFDIDLNPASSPAKLQNIAERRVRFVYLFSTQYDPAHGELTSLTFEEDNL